MTVTTLAEPEASQALDRDQFMQELTLRNRGLIDADDQRRLATATILVAGCGSTGGATVEPLTRAGALHLLLAEPDEYDLSNLNRQRGSVAAVGVNKGEWLARQAAAINPHLETTLALDGITAENAAGLCGKADIVIDAVDVTSQRGLTAKYLLHEAAHAARLPVITAYDIAYRQYIRIYDYRLGIAPFAGKITRLRAAATPMAALMLLIPPTAIPYDAVREIERLIEQPGASISQLGCTADLFGALSVPLVIELLANRPVRKEFTVDLRDAILPGPARFKRRVGAITRLLALRKRLAGAQAK